MLSAFANTFKIPELRQRILFTLGLIFICRLLAAVPLPGVDALAIRQFIEAQGGAEGGLFGIMNLFSGGALLQCSVGTLGIMPYISASIIIQLMTAVIPHLEKLAREGDVGRQKITQYTRYLTVIICAVQGIAMGVALESGGYFGLPAEVVRIPGFGFILLTALSLVTGSLLLMWIGEQMTDRGIGNGISVIITVNIISAMPMAVKTLIDKLTPVDGVAEIGFFHVALMIILIFAVILGVVAVTQAQQKVPVQFAKRMVGRKMMNGGTSHLPLRVNYSGVMPIIFASAILQIFPSVAGYLPYEWAKKFASSFTMTSASYMIVFGLMILFFSYFWVATQFNPVQIADDLKKRGGYIPGIRPGTPTADYLDRTMTRLTLAGAVFLTVVSILPSILTSSFKVPWIVASFFGGTSLLIIVGVMLDTMRQIESHLLMRHYDGFLKKGKMRSGR
ncbi:preprotein translocase subunit SecY [Pontiella agarivorans]|uniref:Protein translocase subunit SecY n=1 Tax=Pontiella agarivorans TaxID=3038953 RepID=A0ABU5MZN3_9BACT|nr:preprotein translocase subunit SecY [Pontiella agarivorans]MDZ8119638.1 preprotein translocase subunit SecY [Pontiella agarivorans]